MYVELRRGLCQSLYSDLKVWSCVVPVCTFGVLTRVCHASEKLSFLVDSFGCRFSLPPHLTLKNFEGLDLGKVEKVSRHFLPLLNHPTSIICKQWVLFSCCLIHRLTLTRVLTAGELLDVEAHIVKKEMAISYDLCRDSKTEYLSTRSYMWWSFF